MASMDIGKSVGCAGSRVGLGVSVGVMVFEGEGDALGVVVDVGVDVSVDVAVDDTVPVGYGVGVAEAVCAGLGRVEAGLGVADGFGDAVLAGWDVGGVVAVTESAACPQALKNRPRARKAKATPYILRMGVPPREMPDCTA